MVRNILLPFKAGKSLKKSRTTDDSLKFSISTLFCMNLSRQPLVLCIFMAKLLFEGGKRREGNKTNNYDQNLRE